MQRGKLAFSLIALALAGGIALSACATKPAAKSEGRSERDIRAAFRACDKLPMEQREGCRISVLAEEQRTIERGG